MCLQNKFTNHIYLIYTYKQDLALNHQQRLICHKMKPTCQKWEENLPATKEIAVDKKWTWQRRGNLRREIESPLIAT